MNRHRFNAYMTIEAGLVLPLVIGVFLFLFEILVYWYDSCLLEQDLAMVAVRSASELCNKSEGRDMYIEERLSDIYREKYVLCKWNKLEAGIKHHNVFVEGAGVTGIRQKFEIESKYNIEIFDPVGFIRGVDKFTGQGNGGENGT